MVSEKCEDATAIKHITYVKYKKKEGKIKIYMNRMSIRKNKQGFSRT